jgi:hypothetical protein
VCLCSNSTLRCGKCKVVAYFTRCQQNGLEEGHKEVCGSAEKPDEKKPDEKKPDEPIPSADAPADKMPNEPTLCCRCSCWQDAWQPPSADAPAVKSVGLLWWLMESSIT